MKNGFDGINVLRPVRFRYLIQHTKRDKEKALPGGSAFMDEWEGGYFNALTLIPSALLGTSATHKPRDLANEATSKPDPVPTTITSYVSR